MKRLAFTSAHNAVVAGALVAAALLGLWLASSRIDVLGLVSFLARWLHVLAAMLWIGMIWFVNFIQLPALEEADEAGRATIHKLVGARVVTTFRRASHVTLASGAVLLVTTGYLFDRWVFASAVYVPPLKGLLLWSGTAAAVVMWVLVHMVIWPAVRVVQSGADADAKAAARGRVRLCARINLFLAVPVTFVMVAAAHLY